MIQVDQDAIKEARDKSAYDVIFHASRMLLVTRGLDPQDAAGVFDAFTEHFIHTGYVDSAFKALISQAKAEGKQGSYDNAKANALADSVITLYEGMDDSLQFKREKVQESKGSKVNVPVPVNVHKDLRGVLCPMNFVKTKLELATMQSGDVLEIWLDDGKPIENVPGSVKLEGHEILSQTQHTDGYCQQQAADHCYIAGFDRNGTRSYRPFAFARMLSVGFHVINVVKTVDAARHQTEGGKGIEGREQQFRIQQVVAEEQRCQNKYVLHPLQRSE